MKTTPSIKTPAARSHGAIATPERRKLVSQCFAALAACVFLPATPALAQLQTVVEFTGTGGGSKGNSPEAVLASDGAGFLWGTTAEGGANGLGTMFKVNAGTGVLTPLLDFTGNGTSNKGRGPRAGMARDGAGFFWGTTQAGGANDLGTVFKVNAVTGTLATLVEFTGNGASNKGTGPRAALASDEAGFFWSTTVQGGAGNFGTVFKINAVTGALTTLVEFTGTGGGSKGSRPQEGLASDGAGFFWGTTSQGGANDLGTVFKVNVVTGALTTLVEFTGNGPTNKGNNPSARLVSDGAGSFWGTTQGGGASGCGTVFKVNAGTGALTTLVEFTGIGGSNKGNLSVAGLARDGAGFLWGTTSQGGANGRGTVFKANQSSGALTTLAEFTGNSGNSKGTAPLAGLVRDGTGFFWGTTSGGGANGFGTVFKIAAFRPDMLVGLKTSALKGNGIYNTTGASQSQAVKVPVGGSVKVPMKIQNDAPVPDILIVRGTAGDGNFRVTYFRGTTNVTASVVAGTFNTGLLAAGASVTLKAEIKARTSVAGKRRTLGITAKSVGDSTATDRVNIKAKSD
ncbi:MAG: choice-of-anchor tandem repeat GloVer-containing protein [Verrucomicrobiota bacterium]